MISDRLRTDSWHFRLYMFIRHWLLDIRDEKVPTDFVDVCSYIPSFLLLPLAVLSAASLIIYGWLKYSLLYWFLHVAEHKNKLNQGFRKNTLTVCSKYRGIYTDDRGHGLWIVALFLAVVRGAIRGFHLLQPDGAGLSSFGDLFAVISYFAAWAVVFIVGVILTIAALIGLAMFLSAVFKGIWGKNQEFDSEARLGFTDIVYLRVRSFKEKHCLRLRLVNSEEQ